MTDPKTTLITGAMLVIGAYCLPAGVLFGALVGASVFIVYRKNLNVLRKIVLFAVSFISGIFAGSDAVRIVNAVAPEAIVIGEFVGAAVAAALSVGLIEAAFLYLENRTTKFLKREPKP